jgi:hypothetical protein
MPGLGRKEASWIEVVGSATHELAEAQKYLKTPTASRAVVIAEELGSDAEHRELLLHHIDGSRRRRPPPREVDRGMDPDEIDEAMLHLGTRHEVALNGLDTLATRDAYDDVFVTAATIAGRIDPLRHSYPYVQVMLYLHDAASVLDRHDLGLSAARRALLVLAGLPRRGSQGDLWARFWTNSLLAEVVSLNNLGLAGDALRLTQCAEREPGYTVEPAIWQRSFLEQRLGAIAVQPRSSVYLAESTADKALRLADSVATQARINGKLIDVYLAHATTRSVRRAARLASDLHNTLMEPLTPLRHVIALRTLARYWRAAGDHANAVSLHTAAMDMATAGNLRHQLLGLADLAR